MLGPSASTSHYRLRRTGFEPLGLQALYLHDTLYCYLWEAAFVSLGLQAPYSSLCLFDNRLTVPKLNKRATALYIV